MPRLEVTIRSRLHTVVRETDGHTLLVLETLTDKDVLFDLAVIDPRDYDE
jgi:hypothetical protein